MNHIGGTSFKTASIGSTKAGAGVTISKTLMNGTHGLEIKSRMSTNNNHINNTTATNNASNGIPMIVTADPLA